MNDITFDMVQDINQKLSDLHEGFHFRLDHLMNKHCMQLCVNDTAQFVASAIINCTDRFYDWVNAYFAENYQLELQWNNTHSTCWANS